MRCIGCDGIVKFPTKNTKETQKCGYCRGIPCKQVRQARRRGPGAS